MKEAMTKMESSITMVQYVSKLTLDVTTTFMNLIGFLLHLGTTILKAVLNSLLVTMSELVIVSSPMPWCNGVSKSNMESVITICVCKQRDSRFSLP